MDAITHLTLTILNIVVRFDTATSHGMTGFGYVIDNRTYCAGGFASLATARRAAPGHIRRTLRERERARESNAQRERAMRTIGSWGSL